MQWSALLLSASRIAKHKEIYEEIRISVPVSKRPRPGAAEVAGRASEKSHFPQPRKELAQRGFV